MSNYAAWLKLPKAQLEVDDAPKAIAGPEEIMIKNAFVAINPVDWKVQARSPPPPIHHYPSILGQDIAGEVVEVGLGVTRVRVGDRVIAYVYIRGNGKIYLCVQESNKIIGMESAAQRRSTNTVLFNCIL